MRFYHTPGTLLTHLSRLASALLSFNPTATSTDIVSTASFVPREDNPSSAEAHLPVSRAGLSQVNQSSDDPVDAWLGIPIPILYPRQARLSTNYVVSYRPVSFQLSGDGVCARQVLDRDKRIFCVESSSVTNNEPCCPQLALGWPRVFKDLLDGMRRPP